MVRYGRVASRQMGTVIWKFGLRKVGGIQMIEPKILAVGTPGRFLYVLGLIASLGAGLSACAPAAQHATEEGWPTPRPLGATIPSYRPIEPPAISLSANAVPDEPTGVITLGGALAQALLKNPALAAFSWEVRVADARVLQAGLVPNPELSAEVENFGGSKERRDFVGAESTVSLSQLIELGGKREKRARVARLERDLAGWDYEAKRLDVYVATAKAFMNVLAAQQRRDLKRDQLALALRVHDTVEERVNAGRSAAVEKTKAAVELASSRIELERANRELQTARYRLAAAWGGTEVRFTRAEGQFDNFLPLGSLAELLKRLPESPDLLRTKLDFELRRSQLELERARNVPDLTFSAGVRRFEDNEDNAFIAGVSIPIPVFGLNPGGVLEARRRISQQGERQRATIVEITSALKQAHQEGAALSTELAALRDDILPGAQKVFEDAQQGYRQGKFDFLNVLDAQRTLFSAHERYIEVAAAYHRATLDIERLTGQPLTPTE